MMRVELCGRVDFMEEGCMAEAFMLEELMGEVTQEMGCIGEVGRPCRISANAQTPLSTPFPTQIP